MNLTNKESSNIQFNNIDKVMPMHVINEQAEKPQFYFDNEPYLMKSDKLNYSTMLNNEPGETRLNDFTII